MIVPVAPRENAERGPAIQPSTRPARAYAVDALRGLAFLGVVLGEAKPYEVLPAWMYHAQEPPPAHAMNTAIAGLTFPDLVFPFFLFTMGVAIPLALTRRMEKGAGYVEILRRGVVTRFVLLMFLALFRNNFDSAAYDATGPMAHQPQSYAWILGLLGFGVLFAVFTRLPEGWSRGRRLAVRLAGWTAAILLFALSHFSDGSHIRLHQIDDILVINAYCVALATLIWLVTRHNLMARLAIVAVIAAIRLNNGHEGWVNDVYNFEPFRDWYDFSFIEYLCVTIPGTIIGDMFLAWSRSPQAEVTRPSLFVAGNAPPVASPSWSIGRTAAAAGVLFLNVPLLLVGIQSRYVFATTIGAALLCGVAIALTKHPSTPTESLIARLVRWGTCWLLLGLFLDPYEGGTHKVPPTFAWFFQGCGLAIFVLLALFVVINVLRQRRWVQLLIDNGQNPMMGYVGYGMLVLPLLGLSGIKDLFESLEPSPWVAFGEGLIVTLVVAFIVRFFTRRRLFWRS